MFKVLILICAASVSKPDCQVDTAVDIIQGPDVKNELMCGLHSQAYLAQTEISYNPKTQYIKVKCTRTSIGKDNVG